MATTMSWPTAHWHRLGDGRVQCDLCPRECRMREGQQGLCFVRANNGGRVVLTSYGRSSGFCIDPIEKKPLNHFLPGTPVLSFGTAGCNLACKFCQNWDVSRSRDVDTLAETASPEALARVAREHQCRGIALTYNDPVIFHEYAVDVALAAREQQVASVAVTAGYVSAQPRAEFFAVMDAANIDLKAFSERFYRKVVGGALGPVLETLQYVYHETDTWLELTTLLIPGENDSSAEIDALTGWVVEHLGPEVPMHFTAFHPDWKMMDTPATPLATLRRARAIALGNGVRHAYTGNVHDADGDTTVCSGCARPLIVRDWYEIRRYALTEQGTCPDCGVLCAGRFEPRPGTWGARRQPLRIRSITGSEVDRPHSH